MLYRLGLAALAAASIPCLAGDGVVPVPVPGVLSPVLRLSGSPFPSTVKVTSFSLDPSGKRSYLGADGVPFVAEWNGTGFRIFPVPRLAVTATAISAQGLLVTGNGYRPGQGIRINLATKAVTLSNLSANLKIGGLALADNGRLVAVTGWSGESWVSDDGRLWVKTARLEGIGALFFVYKDPNTGFLYTGGEQPAGLFESRDHGVSWEPIGLSVADGYGGNTTGATVNALGELLALRYWKGSVVQRRRGGVWQACGSGVPPWATVYGLLNIRGTLIVSANGRIWVSMDHGDTWFRAAQDLTPKAYRIGAGPNNTLLIGTASGLYKATVLKGPG